jgi:hypothetical protein
VEGENDIENDERDGRDGGEDIEEAVPSKKGNGVSDSHCRGKWLILRLVS